MPGSSSQLALYLKSSRKPDAELGVTSSGSRSESASSDAVAEETAELTDENNSAPDPVEASSLEQTDKLVYQKVAGRGIPLGMATRTGNGGEHEKSARSDETESSALTTKNESESDTQQIDEAASAKSRVDELLSRVEQLVGPGRSGFEPKSPGSISATGLTSEEIEKLVLKMLNSRGSASGRQIATQTCLPFPIIETVLKALRSESLVALKGAAEAGDYDFVLTDGGRQRANEYIRDCSYFGAAPVCLGDYLAAMAAQSIAKQEVTEPDLKRAFADLIISPHMLDRLGPAVNSGRGMFLFGEPGNGKTSIAERITSAFSSHIWIPRALGIDGEILRLFDPGMHEVVKEEESDSLIDLSGIDRRWVHIVRPTIIVGGELTMDELEVTQNPVTRICEAPVQLKSNCGTLVIDDFGRQRMPVDELLNRWIVPLEKRYDFLNLPSGKKIQVPFDQLIIFSTNLEPSQLVDGAFLRRIPYKIQVVDPTADEFRAIFDAVAPYMGFEYDSSVVEYLIAQHYALVNRPFRSCHVRDLLLQVRNYCTYRGLPRKMSNEAMDFAVENYFSVL